MLTTKSTLWKMKQTRREKDIPDRMFLARALAEEGIPLDPPLREAASDANIPGQSPIGGNRRHGQESMVSLSAERKEGQQGGKEQGDGSGLGDGGEIE
jgi:hypothetical protein